MHVRLPRVTAEVYNQRVEAPFVPELHADDDTSHFEKYPDSAVEESGPALSSEKNAAFSSWGGK
jgi:hypothetical protein